MEPATFGLIGVVVGGLLTGGTQVFLDWRKERSAARRAKLLVCGELLQLSLVYRSLAKGDAWPDFPDARALLPSTAWQENRTHLTRIDEDLWNEICMLYIMVETDRARIQVAHEDSGFPPPLTDPVKDGLAQTALEIADLRRRLGCGGGWEGDIPHLLLREHARRARRERDPE